MEEPLLAALLADAGVAALVGDNIQWRQRVGVPAIALHFVDGAPIYHLKGRLRFSRTLTQIDCWGRTSAEATAIRNAVLAATDTLKAPALQVFVLTIRTGSAPADGVRQDGTGDLFRDSLDVRVCTTEPLS